MRTQPAQVRRRAAAAVLCCIAAIATAACAAPAVHTTVAEQPVAADVAPVGGPVVVDCAVRGETHPGQYNLACAGAGAYLSGLHWASWASSAAFADGFSTVNDCVPSCVAGHGHTFPVLVTLWRAEPRPGHAGQRYFTRLTVIYTGGRTYRAVHALRQLPVTATYPLSAYGGA